MLNGIILSWWVASPAGALAASLRRGVSAGTATQRRGYNPRLGGASTYREKTLVQFSGRTAYVPVQTE